AAFDCFILERNEAHKNYSSEQLSKAEAYYSSLSKDDIDKLTHTILLGLPGDEEMNLEKFRLLLKGYENIDDRALRANLYSFLQEIIPVAEEYNVRMAIHPDDPPFSLFGLPRIVSTEDDARTLLDAVDSPCNGLTFCTGSYGARPDNDLPGMIKRMGDRINFIHLRSVKCGTDGSFQEASHLEGDTDMYAIMQALIKEQQRRQSAGRTDINIPMRPDHGHRLLDD